MLKSSKVSLDYNYQTEYQKVLDATSAGTPNTIVQRDANTNAVIGSYLGHVSTIGDLNTLSPSYKDFAWVLSEKEFYWWDGSKWFPHDVKRFMEGFTLVNRLGSYGGFEKDSNGDGIADGWAGNISPYSSIATGIQGNAQQISVDFTSDTNTIANYLEFAQYFDPTHTYYLSYWVNPNIAGGGCGHLLYHTPNSNPPIQLDPTVTHWQKLYGSFHVQPNHTFLTPYIYAAADWLGAVAGTTYTAIFDNFCVYDLTWMDTYSPMPQSLQEKYSVSKWVDMTDDDLAVELPYVDGVAYVGVES